MFFPFNNYDKVSVTNGSGFDQLVYTTTFKCMIVVETLNFDPASSSDQVFFYVDGAGAVNDIYFWHTLNTQVTNASSQTILQGTVGSSGSVIVESGRQIRFSSSEGSNSFVLHVFGLPEAI